MTNPAPISGALREALAKVPDTFARSPKGLPIWRRDSLVACRLIEREVVPGRTPRSFWRRTALGRSLMGGKS